MANVILGAVSLQHNKVCSVSLCWGGRLEGAGVTFDPAKGLLEDAAKVYQLLARPRE